MYYIYIYNLIIISFSKYINFQSIRVVYKKNYKRHWTIMFNQLNALTEVSAEGLNHEWVISEKSKTMAQYERWI